MKYVVTFENYDGECESVTIDGGYYIGYVVEQAISKTNNNYKDFDIVSIVRI